MSLNILAVGSSRNIGYFSSLKFLDAGHTVTYLLRSKSTFDNDEKVQAHIAAGKAFLVQGDALVLQDVQKAFQESQSHSPLNKVDLCLFTVGGTPKFAGLKGFVLSPPDLVTHSVLNVLRALPSLETRLIAISSTGLTRTSHASLPLPMKPMYSWLLDSPHKDKVGVERVLHHCAGWTWNTKEDGEPEGHILPEGWQNDPSLPSPGTLKRLLVIRPAFLTDGDSKAEKEKKKIKDGKEVPPYRVSEEELGGWVIARKDVAHFIADAALNRWDEYEGKIISIAY